MEISPRAQGYLIGMILEVLAAKEKARGEQTTIDTIAGMLGQSVSSGNVAQFNFEALDADERAAILDVIGFVQAIRAMQAQR